MATPLDAGLVSFLMPAVVFLFILVATYAFLSKLKLFGDNASFNAIIAFCVALMFIIVPQATNIILDITPWMLVFTGFIVLIFVFFMVLGVKGEDLVKNVVNEAPFLTIVIAGFVILFLVALTNAFGPFLVTNQEPGFWNSVKRTLFHPRVLGVLFLLVVGSYTVRYIAAKVE